MAIGRSVPVIVTGDHGVGTSLSRSARMFLQHVPGMRILGEENSIASAIARARNLNAHVIVISGYLGLPDLVGLWKAGAFNFEDD